MSMSQQVDPLIGRLVDDRYRVRARIARGGMATVYVATDLRLERRVALKVMHSHLSDDSVFQSRFIQEARTAARLSDPHVVNVFDQGQDGELAYLVMEYLPGITLRELLKEQRRLTVTQTITIMDAVLAGLSAAHRAGLIHRDVKPENVLLAEDGRIKIGDFGLARATSANTATGQQLLGTIAYLAPELVTRGTADTRSDIYALGIMLYEMLAGEQPYKGEQPMQIAYQHATESVPRPSVKNPGVPEQLDELVLWATEKEPDERPSDAQQMLERLREIERELGVTPLPTRTAAASRFPEELPDEGEQTGGQTKVMPEAATSVLPPSLTSTGPQEDADNAAVLRRRAKRRRARGVWLIVLTLLLAGGAAGAGWWWGSGPGSYVAVPDLDGLTYAEAESTLAGLELDAQERTENTLDVPAGEVIRTDPSEGARVDRDTVVTVVTSAGPASAELGQLAGLSADEVRGLLEDSRISVAEDDVPLFAEEAEGTVLGVSITPAAGGDPVDCAAGCSVHQGDAAQLTVSLGELPNVVGMSSEEAAATLDAVGVKTEVVSQEYHDTVPEGHVIYFLERSEPGSWRPGDTVRLVTSLGPQLFEVPDVVGMTRDEAKAELEAAGFAYSYNGLWDAVVDEFTEVVSMSPEGGSQQRAGTTITLTITGSF
ncbi:serine/threonine protein kinase [Microbacterium barkeri]|uniref:non-specific serine/threonine protein kinase n=2 Tax=Microbacterium barkeri TaxID=33917 RepID=A0A9W6H3C9_9MICO|nr:MULTISPECIES: Stk1 family PASTA domain-containing Ser/Thr kinase [Microbacterium]WRH17850.1 Stk1 family PASTA domain-containing Ser/Thr kinase [Microbacterium sp. JZ37]GLJ61567.1 serine/threonine protein kinase [Microbacterium barkeri]